MIHEQNAVLGMTNKYLSRLANKTLLAFPLARKVRRSKKWPVVGNPVRQDIASLHQTGKAQLPTERPLQVLVIGGSLGARVLNLTLPRIFTELSETYSLRVIHQVGKGNFMAVNEDYLTLAEQAPLEFVVREFIDDMPAALAQADLVICRSGALTVSELAASGNAGIFVPLPHAVDDHQTANANWLVSEQAGILVAQQDLEQRLPLVLAELLAQPEQINKMQQQAAAKANLTTTDTIYQLCQTLEKTT